ncbi:MAG: polyprenol monophosphomannose synthase [Chloroflexota bacterium]
MHVTVVMPTYNESDNLSQIVTALCALPVPNLRVLVVDDNSPDGTGQLADTVSASSARRVQVLHRMQKAGLGSAYIAGFQRALADGADYVIQMDADFSHSPEYIPQLLAKAKEYDVVVGSRYVRGGKLDERWSFGRYFLSWWANSVWVRLILGLRVRDATAGFKCWRRHVLEAINLDMVRSNGYDFQVEMAYLCERMGFHVVEIPIYFEDRRIGQSKMSIPVKLEAALRVLEIRWRHRFGRDVSARVDQKREPI